MKIKTAFVTNSSSSSFIVAWPRKIETKEDVDCFIDKKYSSTVFHDSKIQTPKNDPDILSTIVTELKEGYVEVNYDSIEKQICKRENITSTELIKTPLWFKQLCKEIGYKTNEIAHEKAEQFLKEIPNESYIYIFEYGDDSGDIFAEMEHGNIFKKLPHIRVNKH